MGASGDPTDIGGLPRHCRTVADRAFRHRASAANETQVIGPVAVLHRADGALRRLIGEVAGPELELRFPADTAPETLTATVKDARYVVVHSVKLTEALLARAQRVELIHRWGTGLDGFPIRAMQARGIVAARTFGTNAPSVADLTLGLMLAVLRRVPQAQSEVRRGPVSKGALWTDARDLTGRRVALVGFGRIGQAVARRLRGFDCDVMCVTRSGVSPEPALARAVPLAEALGTAEVLSLHVPLTAETRHVLGRRELGQMQRGAVVINTARGALVDETALEQALRTGQIAAAGLDVFVQEPVATDHPLLALPNVLALPHIGGATRDNLVRQVRHWAGNIGRHHRGEPLAVEDLVGQDGPGGP
ncbi:dehydrogenase [Rhodobacteraceae bacterium CCMM004]|nr:dehydrogenase [Rhodobacteraceae bacterium CCMM004]